MIGEQKLSIDGKEYALRADWKTGQLIAERVADPFTIIADFAKAQALGEITGYEAQFDFNMTNSIRIIHAGLDGINAGVSIDDVGNYFMGSKMAAATSAAMAFIMLFSSDADLLGEGETNGEGKEPTGENS
tara:strand:- start:215 stop:607 length:393 start_codon:yes stop_codon:yes gene_type:complete